MNTFKKIAVGGVLAAVATTGFAANQGSNGFNSTGDLLITLNINDEVRISNLGDITLDFAGADISDTSPACIYRNGGADYQVTATGDGAANAFTLTDGTNTIAYTVSFDDGAADTPMASGTALARTNATGTDDDCVTNGGNNATITVGVAAAAANSLPQAAYTGTLTLLVAPN
ncbi:MAG: hypothetical protein AAF529_13805 [Pseudomonadota bacterium]